MMTTPESVTGGHESRRPSARLRFAVAFLVGLVLALGLGTGALYAYDQQYTGRVLPGVAVGDVDLSGLTPDAARAALQGAYHGYADGRIVLTGPDGLAVITYAEIGMVWIRKDWSLKRLPWVATGRPSTAQSPTRARPSGVSAWRHGSPSTRRR